MIGSNDSGRSYYEVTRRMITVMVSDLVSQTRTRLRLLSPASPDDIRRAQGATVAFSDEMSHDIARLKAFLFERVHRHERVMHVMRDAEAIVRDLFDLYLSEPDTMQDAWRAAAADLSERQRARLIADFVAGMTDRYALAEHGRLFDATPDLR